MSEIQPKTPLLAANRSQIQRKLATIQQKRCFRQHQAKIGQLAANRLENHFSCKEGKNSVTATNKYRKGFQYDKAEKSVIQHHREKNVVMSEIQLKTASLAANR